MESDSNTVHKGIRKGLYLIPTAFTAANIAMGFLSVLASVRGYQIIDSNPEQAAIYFNYAAKAIGLAILFDTLDGRLARMTKTSTELGVQLDSLADVLTFGIAPVVLAYSWGIGATFNEADSLHNIGVFVLFVYLMCGVLRLARFNLQATRPRVLMEGSQKVDKKNFVGLPIPPAAGLIAAIVHFGPTPISILGENIARFYTISLIVLTASLGLLMVSTLKYTSFKNVGTGRRNFYLILVLGTIGMLIWLYSQYVLLLLAATYVGHGVVWYLMGLLRTRSGTEADASTG
ncbi:MAG: phosphatidylcholine/phosphatidylserine synthase [Acidobacteria bacterium]|nr:MAG: phosphatidylcholine/phosphatidylserine synthase [Acidobacteriota bacterium]REK01847.1 MAG: phosphatidylcholine/phosphatidylserine synthase [Acidobacteriota bacterium]REK14803.1 MAG: phosphatidylcholine/phosphatidylserine synthase [Acidobacteriota bacterium]REK45518.1 MAG: phosphatidylcholine/phosphatidylserine synthase [Acidobacteriota bacterium]